MADQLMCQNLVSVVDNSVSPNGKFDIRVSGNSAWQESGKGAKALFIVAVDSSKPLIEVKGFEGWTGRRYPTLEVDWSPDSSKVAICRGVRKGGGISVYMYRNHKFARLQVLIPDINRLLENESALEQPWQKLYRRDGEWIEIKEWEGNSALHIMAYGDLYGVHSNDLALMYNISVKVEVSNEGTLTLGKPNVVLKKPQADQAAPH